MRVGILGGGQLGRMLALAGYPLGIRFRFLDPAPHPPAADLAECVKADFADDAALERFVNGVDVLTYEFENVPVTAVRKLEKQIRVYPPPRALEVSQDRLLEKSMFQKLGVPTVPFYPVSSPDELEDAATALGYPAVVKTRRGGYDGKGQYLLRSSDDLPKAWNDLGSVPLIVEGFVRFERELSLMAVRARDGECRYYPLVENHHHTGILRLSLAPAPNCDETLQQKAEDYVSRVLEATDYVGLLVIEFFQTKDGLLANEMAPRVHNSGHWTIEGAKTSQFENHMRAVTGLPLGLTEAVGHSAMLNIVGAAPEPAAVLRLPGAHLHLYGKAPRPRRKLGHITLWDQDASNLSQTLTAAKALLPDGE